MQKVSARLPSELIVEMDQAATRLHRTRSEIVRQAVEYYLNDLEGLERLQDPADPLLDWEEVRHELLDQD